MPKVTTKQRPRTVKALMWYVTEPTASFLFSVSNVALIIGATAVLIGTIGSILMGAAKEQFSNERISANEAETAHAKEAAALAIQKAEQERTGRMQLELKLAPRRLSATQSAVIARELKPIAQASGFVKQHASVIAIPETNEANNFAMDLSAAIANAGWTTYLGRNGMTGNIPPSAGVVIRTSSNPRSIAAGDAVAAALSREGFLAAVLPERARGCEEEARTPEYMDREPACFMIQLVVRDHP